MKDFDTFFKDLTPMPLEDFYKANKTYGDKLQDTQEQLTQVIAILNEIKQDVTEMVAEYEKGSDE